MDLSWPRPAMSGSRFVPLVLFFGLLALPAAAQPGASLSDFSFLRFDASARVAGLGSAYTAVADGDVNALFYNPAIPGPATDQVASVSYLNHLSDINAGTIAYSRTDSGTGMTVSGGLRFVRWGTFEGRSGRGERTGPFTAGDGALTLGTSRALGDRARYGANVHVVYGQIDRYQAVALATDLGVLYRLPPYGLSLGGSLRHLGVTVDPFAEEEVSLPVDLQVGVTKQLAHLPVLLSLTAYDLTRLDEGIEGGGTVDHVLAHLTFGGEARLGRALRLRLGYNHRRSREVAVNERFDLAGFSGGFGVAFEGLSVDYAYSSWSEIGGLHQLTIRADVTSF